MTPDTQDWIEWAGGERPVPALARVDYRLRCGIVVTRGALAEELRWAHLTPPNGGDIVAYRLSEK